jgi:hypothetical protein
MEDKIVPREEQYQKLLDFEVTPPIEEIKKKNGLRDMLLDFRNSMLQAENLLGKSKKSMRAQLENDLITFQQTVRDCKAEFQRGAPFDTKNFTTKDAFINLEMYENILNEKRAQEDDFGPKLKLFQI